jgi:hypothetical protein
VTKKPCSSLDSMPRGFGQASRHDTDGALVLTIIALQDVDDKRVGDDRTGNVHGFWSPELLVAHDPGFQTSRSA